MKSKAELRIPIVDATLLPSGRMAVLYHTVNGAEAFLVLEKADYRRYMCETAVKNDFEKMAAGDEVAAAQRFMANRAAKAVENNREVEVRLTSDEAREYEETGEAPEVQSTIDALSLTVKQEETKPYNVNDECTDAGSDLTEDRLAGFMKVFDIYEQDMSNQRIAVAVRGILTYMAAIPMKVLMKWCLSIPKNYRYSIVITKMTNLNSGPNGFEYIPPAFTAFIEGEVNFEDEISDRLGGIEDTPAVRILNRSREQELNSMHDRALKRPDPLSLSSVEETLVKAAEEIGKKSGHHNRGVSVP